MKKLNRKGVKHINFLQKILPYLSAIFAFILAFIKYQHGALAKDLKQKEKDVEQYRKMWLDEIKNVDMLNAELLKLKQDLRDAKDENIELKSRYKRLKKKIKDMTKE